MNLAESKFSHLLLGGVFSYCFFVHLLAFGPSITPDKLMWARQIEYFLYQDPLLFDFYKAYGHPGGPLIVLGCFFRLLFDVDFVMALNLAMSMIISGATAGSAFLCARLFPESLWWLAAALTLSLNRLYLWSTPPTATVLPLAVFLVISVWWIWGKSRQDSRPKWLVALGVLAGVAAATRLDATIMVAGPLLLLLIYRYRALALQRLVFGGTLGFLAGDPFMWYMPVRHLWDLVRKFTMHYSEFVVPHSIHWYEWIHAALFAIIFVVWAGFTLVRKTQTELVPKPILIVLLTTWGAAVCLLLSSSFQAVRYLYPIIVIAEVLLPLYILESQKRNIVHLAYSGVGTRPKAATRSCLVVLLVTFVQLSAFLLP